MHTSRCSFPIRSKYTTEIELRSVNAFFFIVIAQLLYRLDDNRKILSKTVFSIRSVHIMVCIWTHQLMIVVARAQTCRTGDLCLAVVHHSRMFLWHPMTATWESADISEDTDAASWPPKPNDRDCQHRQSSALAWANRDICKTKQKNECTVR